MKVPFKSAAVALALFGTNAAAAPVSNTDTSGAGINSSNQGINPTDADAIGEGRATYPVTVRLPVEEQAKARAIYDRVSGGKTTYMNFNLPDAQSGPGWSTASSMGDEGFRTFGAHMNNLATMLPPNVDGPTTVTIFGRSATEMTMTCEAKRMNVNCKDVQEKPIEDVFTQELNAHPPVRARHARHNAL
ncbi:MAG TPA: hypothetical protein VFR09_01850 [Alphaproteobacteria bacterium]|nr:hypothetical protein [Alphaproteobacteria bacterium]